MKFSIIYSFDTKKGQKVGRFYPSKNLMKKFYITESGKSEYSSEFLDTVDKHRKLCGILDKKEFIQFCDELWLGIQSVETGGSIGAPGMGYGISPAISFTMDCYEADDPFIADAYVTPMPDVKNKPLDKPYNERDFQRIKKIMLNMF